MHKKKKVKTTIVEKYKYGNDDEYGITLAPELLLRLMEFAHTEAKSDERLHAIVTRAHILSHKSEGECLYMEHYPLLVTELLPPIEEVPVEEVATLPVE